MNAERPHPLRIERLEDRTTPATFTVSTLDDGGPGSLRQALADANATPGPDEVVFAEGLAGTINLAQGPLPITDDVTVRGGGRVTIDGNNGTTVVAVGTDLPPEVPLNVRLEGLTITRGGGGPGQAGVTMTTGVVLTVADSDVFGNAGTGIGGQSQAEAGSDVRLVNSRVIENAGVGVSATEVALTDSRVSDNGDNGVFANRITVSNSLIADNKLSGIAVGLTSIRPGLVTIEDGTVSGNGEFGLRAVGAAVTVRGGTVSGNGGFGISASTADLRNSTVVGNGGGVVTIIGGDANVVSSLVAGNTATGDRDLRIDGTLTVSNTLVGDNTGSGLAEARTPDADGNLVGTSDDPLDPRLAPLADNGGPTRTHALLPDSPAIDAGSNPDGLAFDQRGRGFPRLSGSAADMGAFEFGSEPSEAFAVGGGGVVQVRDAALQAIGNFAPFADAGDGPRVALGRITDAVNPAVAAVTGPGVPARLAVLDARTGSEVRSSLVFEGSFTGGAFVAAGDVTGDGFADVAVSPDVSGGPRVRLFDGRTGEQLADFFGIEDPDFRGGVRVALADVNGDGLADLIVAAGFGGGPRVAVFDGASLRPGTEPRKLLPDFFVFEQSLRNGVFVAGGDLDGDGFAEVIVGGGPGGGPRVFALDGRSLSQNAAPVQAANFFAGDPQSRGGVRVAARDLSGDGRAEIVTGAGEGDGSAVNVYTAVTPDGTPDRTGGFDALEPGFTAGVFVG